ncbi:unnamed protein product [Discosporangium mesarthrocarpum]
MSQEVLDYGDFPIGDVDMGKDNKENDCPDSPATSKLNAAGGGARSGRKSVIGRRRSSGRMRRLSGFGGIPADVTGDMDKNKGVYNNMVRLASENKITKKECWSYPLIDVMGPMLLGNEGLARGSSMVNFQKASCTLEASVKIYSHRVDETYDSSYMLLENMGRSEDGPKSNKKHAAVGGTDTSAKRCVEDTLKKPEQLNIGDLERAFDVDPIFSKMSKTFDEAGSRGMLLNNLSVRDGCRVSFDSKTPVDQSKIADSTERKKNKTVAAEGGDGSSHGRVECAQEDGGDIEGDLVTGSLMVDVSKLRQTLSSLCTDLAILPLCPQLEEYRRDIALLEGENTSGVGSGVGGDGHREGVRDEFVGMSYGRSSHSGSSVGSVIGLEAESVEDRGGGAGAWDTEAGGGLFNDDDDDDDDGGGGGGVGDNGDDAMSSPGQEGHDGGNIGGGGSVPLGVDGNGSYGGLSDRLYIENLQVDDEYSFFDYGAASHSTNHWAGTAHWSFNRLRKRVAAKSAQATIAEGDELEEEHGGGEGRGKGKGKGKGKGGRRPRKKAFTIDFFSEVRVTSKAMSKGRGRKMKLDPTRLTDEYIKRTKEAARSGPSINTLPVDLHYGAKDMARLRHRPLAVARPKKGEGGGAAAGGGFVDRYVNLVACTTLRYCGESGAFDSEDEFTGGGFVGGDFGDGGFNFEGAEGEASAAGGGAEEGLGVGNFGEVEDKFRGQGLLEAGREVEKISIGYARKAKRVDVRLLKGSLWRHIKSKSIPKPTLPSDALEGTDEEGGRCDAAANKGPSARQVCRPHSPWDNGVEESQLDVSTDKGSEMCFSDVIEDVASKKNGQAGATVPFYFICLLHLANEKGLCLEGQRDLRDFAITTDPSA